MIIYIYGDDTFRSRQYLKEQVEKFKKARDPQGYNVVVLDGAKADSGKVFTEIYAMPFLAEKRMIVIENILSSSEKELLAELIVRIKENRIPESNITVFWQGEGKGKVKEVGELEKILKAEKYAKEFPNLSGLQLKNWVEQEIKRLGGAVGSQASQYLVNNSANDIWQLSTLLEQLVLFANGKEIQLKEVQLFLGEKADDNVFNMVEAIVSGNHKQAYKLLEAQRKLGEDDFKLFGLISWQFKMLLQMRSLYDSEDSVTSDVAAKKLKIHPFVAKKNWAMMKKNPIKYLTNIYNELLEIDIKTKT
ncbi:MAG: DNA polymerase III subunit delta, partial [bacterium]|nr:DNA polymerase III subunit delta [bacterium]